MRKYRVSVTAGSNTSYLSMVSFTYITEIVIWFSGWDAAVGFYSVKENISRNRGKRRSVGFGNWPLYAAMKLHKMDTDLLLSILLEIYKNRKEERE